MADDLISRRWLMECVNEGWIKFDTEKDKNQYIHLVRDIAPSAQPETIKLHVDHALTEEEIKNLKQKIADSLIAFLPSADVQPVIRCKDCDSAECSGVMIYCLMHECYMRDNDFCNYGERKDGEGGE